MTRSFFLGGGGCSSDSSKVSWVNWDLVLRTFRLGGLNIGVSGHPIWVCWANGGEGSMLGVTPLGSSN